MSKQVKKMQMDVLAQTFRGVKDMVFLSATGIDATTDNKVRLGLRKKNITLMMVKNSLMRRVFGDLGVQPGDNAWAGPTLVAWGAESVKDLSREVEAALLKDAKLKDKVKVKTALAEGQPVTFEQALKMPTRKEAIGEIVGMILGPAASIAGCLTGPAAQVASQIQTISEKKPEGEPAPAA
ncbi:MAG TPA: 50S ribosomal protein L10 [Gemmataceae bacterium]|jgi:large subunit ribosomal protein L10